MAQTQTQSGLLSVDSFTPVHWLAIAAAVVSAVIHLYLAPRVMNFNQTMGILFILAGLGYFGGIAIFLTRYWRPILYLVAALFTIVQIVAWVATGMGGGTMGIVDKAVQVVFVVLVGYLYAQTR